MNMHLEHFVLDPLEEHVGDFVTLLETDLMASHRQVTARGTGATT